MWQCARIVSTAARDAPVCADQRDFQDFQCVRHAGSLFVIAIQFKEVDGVKTTSPAGGSKKL